MFAPSPARRAARLVHSFQASDVLAEVRPQDALLARPLGPGAWQFFAWAGLGAEGAAAAVSRLPANRRTVHSVFGRPGVPVDIVVDIDAPMDAATPLAQGRTRTELAAAACAALDRHAHAMGERVARRVVLQSPTPGKTSLHIHAQLDGAVFADFAALREWLRPLRHAVPSMDLGIYRPLGSLRMHGCTKLDGTCRLELLPGIGAVGAVDRCSVVAAPDAVCYGDLHSGGADEELATAMSVVVVDERRLERGPRCITATTAAVAASAATAIVTSQPQRRQGLARPACRLRVSNALEEVPRMLAELPRSCSDDYTLWRTAGFLSKAVALDHAVAARFPDAELVFLNAWIHFSQRSMKYSEGQCSASWRAFPSLRTNQWPVRCFENFWRKHRERL